MCNNLHRSIEINKIGLSRRCVPKKSANSLSVNFRVVLPMITPAIIIVTFIRFIDSFRVFDHIFVLTGGGPCSRTTSISIYISAISNLSYAVLFVNVIRCGRNRA